MSRGPYHSDYYNKIGIVVLGIAILLGLSAVYRAITWPRHPTITQDNPQMLKLWQESVEAAKRKSK